MINTLFFILPKINVSKSVNSSIHKYFYDKLNYVRHILVVMRYAIKKEDSRKII